MFEEEFIRPYFGRESRTVCPCLRKTPSTRSATLLLLLLERESSEFIENWMKPRCPCLLPEWRCSTSSEGSSLLYP